MEQMEQMLLDVAARAKAAESAKAIAAAEAKAAAVRERARVNAGAEALGELFDASEPELEDSEEAESGDCGAPAKR